MLTARERSVNTCAIRILQLNSFNVLLYTHAQTHTHAHKATYTHTTEECVIVCVHALHARNNIEMREIIFRPYYSSSITPHMRNFARRKSLPLRIRRRMHDCVGVCAPCVLRKRRRFKCVKISRMKDDTDDEDACESERE